VSLVWHEIEIVSLLVHNSGDNEYYRVPVYRNKDLMKAKHALIATATTIAFGLFVGPVAVAQNALPQADNTWFTDAGAQLQMRLSMQPNTNRAKNVVIMIADGNGVGTNYATRLFHGQTLGNFGDENVLPKETLPHLALVKTYNVNAQTPDSAGTATAMLAGVKTKAGMIGVDETVSRGDCSTVEAGKVTSINQLMSEAGKSTAIITTARLTHATPAAGYAHAADRNFEDDSALPEGCQVPDIASQLISAMESGMVDLALGGGRRHFIPVDFEDEEGKAGRRTDGRNLIDEAKALGAQYAFDAESFAAIDLNKEGPVLGLFESSHMKYENDRSDEPSLAEMVEASITAMQGNENGFFLAVEAGRVDHANHGSNLYRALTDGVAFAEAVQKVIEMTSDEDTLLIVTADHEHAIAFNGYCGRGTPITGLCYGIDGDGIVHNGVEQLADDGQPYTVVGYLNGGGSILKKEKVATEMMIEAEIVSEAVDDATGEQIAEVDTDTAVSTSDAIQAHGDRLAEDLLSQLDITTEVDEDSGESSSYRWIGSRGPLTQEQATDPDYIQQAMIPRGSETHSGEDVAAYASGPFAHLISGTIEQNYLFNVMRYAATGE